MKKLLASLIIGLISLSALFAQSKDIIFSESFNDNLMPPEYQIMGEGQNNWVISYSIMAGGEPNELKFKYNPIFNGISRFVIPSLDLTNIDEVLFKFKYYIKPYMGQDVKVGVALSYDNGITWSEAWKKTYSTETIGAAADIIAITGGNKQNVMFCLFYEGNSNNIDNWNIDDIEIITLKSKDIGITSIDIPDILDIGTYYDVNFTVTNFGYEEVTSLKACYKVNGNVVVEEEFNTLSIAPGQDYNLTFSDPFSVTLPLTNEIEIEILEVNGTIDDNEDNNILSKSSTVIICTTEYIPMLEVFTSSSCNPCNAGNSHIDNILNNYQGEYSIVKYQMNYPANGDPYYIPACGLRKEYYGVTGIPALVLDAVLLPKVSSFTPNLLTQAGSNTSIVDISGNYYVTGSDVNIEFDIISYMNIDNIKMHIFINERKTTGNMGSNGETEFHHVLMKMVTDDIIHSFTGGEINHFTLTESMLNTNVEEMDDLEVVVILQDPSSKEIYNSKVLYNDNELVAPVKNINISNNDDNTATLSWNKSDNTTPSGYTIYINDEIVASNINQLTYSFDVEDKSLYVCSIIANYDDKRSIKVPGFIYIDNNFNAESISNLFCNQDYIIQWDSPLSMTPIYYNIYVNNELFENTTETFYVFDSTQNIFYRDAQICVTAKYAEAESDKTCVEVTWLNIEDLTRDVIIYPNPAFNKININGNNILSLSIYNSVGHRVRQFNKDITEIDISDLSAGVYSIILTFTDNTYAEEKIIIQK